ncbi:unnamed protein product [Cladocopium goreaui]|uniref:Diaminopropionate ammonia-lyase n=1 Tax=Cladocopium goreaui TaxID=2562237 RepID=A0A9P1CPH5_9DINO|nr:unnamed protein product [Cladocopium goreaui]
MSGQSRSPIIVQTIGTLRTIGRCTLCGRVAPNLKSSRGSLGPAASSSSPAAWEASVVDDLAETQASTRSHLLGSPAAASAQNLGRPTVGPTGVSWNPYRPPKHGLCTSDVTKELLLPAELAMESKKWQPELKDDLGKPQIDGSGGVELPITVTIPRTEAESGLLGGKHTIYVLQVTSFGLTSLCKHSFEDFEQLHAQISSKVSFQLPTLPRNYWWGNDDPNTVQERVPRLAVFLQQLLAQPDILSDGEELLMRFLNMPKAGRG